MKMMTIITPRKSSTALGYSCKLTKSEFTYYCGAFSHTKIMKTPSVEVPVSVRADSCIEAARQGRYVDQFNNVHPVTLGENIFSVTEKGAIHETGGSVTCQGESIRMNGDIVEDVLRLSQYRLTVEQEKFRFEDGEVEALYNRRMLPSQCSESAQYCTTGTAHTYVWRSPKARCKFLKIKAVQLTPEDGFWVDHRNKLMFKMGAEKSFGNDCSQGTYFLTEYSDLYLTQAETEFDIIEELDLVLYVNSRSDYIQHQIERQHRHLSQEIQRSICRKSWFNHDHSEGLLKLPDGRFARVNGDILYVFTCERKTEKIKDTNICYDKVPLINGDFVDPANRVATRHSAEVECDNFPLSVEATEAWVKIGPGVQKRNIPDNRTLLPNEDNSLEHEDLSRGGLYTESELKSWRSLIEFGSFKRAIGEEIARGVCQGKESCNVVNSHPETYDLRRLIPNEVTREFTTPYMRIKAFLTNYGGILSLVVCLKFSFDCLVMLVILSITLARDGWTSLKTMMYYLLCASCSKQGKLRRRVHRIQRLQTKLEAEREDFSHAPPSYRFYDETMREEETVLQTDHQEDRQVE